ncbi:SSU rRNA (adenine(1518)-N(6)/adenine(1519)-N(6))-dimethyltransferase [hydrothermal vent metagenome]|uniref:SSU rRNA (Adenine(1518)-N(6)/adenine(1519)-N(6))-dimethyltransferase n=1 Tax=hydrothermal vent metagenome TaxID=652676 RepID=A0A3B1CD50_9ZZZZ
MKRSAHRTKRLGQCFLIDPSVAERIALESKAGPGSRVLEVGPGRGILTRALQNLGFMVHAVEIDEELYRGLKKEFENTRNVNVERGDARRFDFGSIEAPYQIVSNLPYSISVMLIKIFIENMSKLSGMTLMTQAEVAQRLSAKPGGKHYGSLSIYLSYHFHVDYLFTIGPEAFRPRPKVNSAVIRLSPLATPPVTVDSKDDFFSFVKLAFIHRRKTLRNNLKAEWGDDAALDEALSKTGIAPALRPQNISIEQFADLYNEWKKTEKASRSNANLE